jgi:GGDEF domain-containing protein
LLDLDDAAGDAVRWAFLAAARLFRVNRASLLVSDRLSPGMTVHSSIGLDPDLVSSIHVAAGQGVAGLVLERDVAFIGEASGTRFISVPVHNSRGVVGVLNLTGGRITGMDLSDEDLESACSVASHLGQLLHQADSGIDQDTGFPDEHAFTEQVERELSRSSRSGEAFMLIVIQLLQTRDSAKRVGPRDVAALLRSAGAAVQSVTRGYDLVGRQEGGLALLVPGASSPESLTGRILEVTRRAVFPLEPGLMIQVGWARGPEEAERATALMALAVERSRTESALRPLIEESVGPASAERGDGS